MMLFGAIRLKKTPRLNFSWPQINSGVEEFKSKRWLHANVNGFSKIKTKGAIMCIKAESCIEFFLKFE